MNQCTHLHGVNPLNNVCYLCNETPKPYIQGEIETFTSPTPWDQQQLLDEFKIVCRQMEDIMQAKNGDYAGNKNKDAFANFNQIELLSVGKISREEGCLVRLSDKLSRVSRLLNQSNNVVNEKVEDTLIDLANYAILMLLMLKERQGG